MNMTFIAGLSIGLIAGALLFVGAVQKGAERDIERGWAYLSGEKYFLVIDQDE